MGQTRTPPPMSAVSPLAQDPFPAAVFWGRRCQSLAGWHRDPPTSPPDAFTTRILLTRGGIHPNPGPSNLTNDYPCSVCPRLVTWAGVSFLCSQCHLWVHRRCSGLTRPSQHHSGWICPACATAITPAPTPAPAPAPAPDSMPAIDPAPAPDRVPAPPSCCMVRCLLLTRFLLLFGYQLLIRHRQLFLLLNLTSDPSRYSSSTAMACSTVQWNWPTSSLCTQSSSRPSRKRNFPPLQSHAPSQVTPSSGATGLAFAQVGEAWLSSSITPSPTPSSTPTTFSQGTQPLNTNPSPSPSITQHYRSTIFTYHPPHPAHPPTHQTSPTSSSSKTTTSSLWVTLTPTTTRGSPPHRMTARLLGDSQ